MVINNKGGYKGGR